MKLSLKQEALLRAVGVVVVSFIAGTFLAFVLYNIPAWAFPYLCMTLVLIIGVRLLYKVILDQLEYQEKLKEMTEKKD